MIRSTVAYIKLPAAVVAAALLVFAAATAAADGSKLRLYYGFGIELSGTSEQVFRFKHWLDEIAEVNAGMEILWAISRSRHHLLIEHSNFAVISSGRTLAPMTRNLTNGVGEDVIIKFNAHIPDHGSHRVFADARRTIEFTAVQNLFHELAHAKHKMNGRWPYARSEQAAIAEENVFRRQLAEGRGRPVQRRVRIAGVPICPAGMTATRWPGAELICGFAKRAPGVAR